MTISFSLSGSDSVGAGKHFAPQVTIRGEELQIPDGQAAEDLENSGDPRLHRLNENNTLRSMLRDAPTIADSEYDAG